jgi:hypothetical protein
LEDPVSTQEKNHRPGRQVCPWFPAATMIMMIRLGRKKEWVGDRTERVRGVDAMWVLKTPCPRPGNCLGVLPLESEKEPRHIVLIPPSWVACGVAPKFNRHPENAPI